MHSIGEYLDHVALRLLGKKKKCFPSKGETNQSVTTNDGSLVEGLHMKGKICWNIHVLMVCLVSNEVTKVPHWIIMSRVRS